MHSFKYLQCVEITSPGAGHTGMYKFPTHGNLDLRNSMRGGLSEE